MGGGDDPSRAAVAGGGVGGLGGPGGGLEAYLEDAAVVVVAVPPAFLRAALWGGDTPPGGEGGGGGEGARATAEDPPAAASPLAVDSIVAASLPWYAVYERLGVPTVAAELEADAARRRAADVAAQLEAWTDGGDAWRTETDVGRPDIPGLFEELVHDTF